MTRINCVSPSELCDKHLVAEYRELPRIFTLVGKRDMLPSNIPDHYTLGKGHATFFYNKLQYLLDRWYELRSEMQSRGMEPSDQFLNIVENNYYLAKTKHSEADNIWYPDQKAIQINKKRIADRLSNVTAK